MINYTNRIIVYFKIGLATVIYKAKWYIYIFFLILPTEIALNSAGRLNSPFRWMPLDSGLRYDQACFLTAHNAFANVEDGWHLYMMQSLNIANQLEYGVRGLMLDVYLHDKQLKLCHGGCHFIPTFQKGVKAGIAAMIWPDQGYKLLAKELEFILDWLERHPLEVVTVFLESHVDKKILNQGLLSVKGLEDIALQPHEWDFEENNGEWPTIGWLRKHNKRLILFHEDKFSPKLGAEVGATTSLNQDAPNSQEPFVFWEVWYHVIESQYGVLTKEKACVEREHSLVHADKDRKLYLFNYFGTVASSPAKSRINNSYDNLKSVIEYCQTRNLAQGLTPNFIALDFVDEGEGLELANFYNRQARQSLGILQLYKPIHE